ncbi:MAG: EthD domain-containing protein [Pseudomonadales bacterium]
MDSIIIVQRQAQQSRADFNKHVIAATAKLVTGPATRITAYTIDRDGAALHNMIAGEQTPLVDALILVAGDADVVPLVTTELTDHSCQGFAGEIRYMKQYPADAVVEGQTRGLFMITPTRRRQGMSRADFNRHWRDNHGPMAERIHVGMWDYYQVFFEHRLAGPDNHYDGISLMGFPDQDAFFAGLFATPEGQAEIEADIERFLDLNDVYPAFLVETVIQS